MERVGGPELGWKNKELHLRATGADGYQWVAPDDPRTETRVRLRPVARIGAKQRDGGENLLIAGDAFEELGALGSHRAASTQLSDVIRLVDIDPPFNRRQDLLHDQY